MEISPTWDIVIMSAFVLAFSYNFLLGKRGTIKLILSTYIAILTADGFADLLRKIIYLNSTGLQNWMGDIEIEVFTGIRIVVFIFAILILVIKGGFHVHLDTHDHWAGRSAIHAVFSLMSAALFLSTILIYISGNSFVEGIMYASEINIYQESIAAKALIDYYQAWFSLPAIGFLITSFFFEPKSTM